MRRKGKTSSAFTRIKADLEDAIAFHAGERQLTIRDVELKPPAPEWRLKLGGSTYASCAPCAGRTRERRQ